VGGGVEWVLSLLGPREERIDDDLPESVNAERDVQSLVRTFHCEQHLRFATPH
jgi:hypothetical protein